jgi:hypothetical protein
MYAANLAAQLGSCFDEWSPSLYCHTGIIEHNVEAKSKGSLHLRNETIKLATFCISIQSFVSLINIVLTLSGLTTGREPY